VKECLLSFGTKPFIFRFDIQNTKVKIYRSITLPDVLYGCATWSPILKEERGTRVFENRC
jgi:hypothetical protein